jgi:hypothetical protein
MTTKNRSVYIYNTIVFAAATAFSTATGIYNVEATMGLHFYGCAAIVSVKCIVMAWLAMPSQL